MEILFEDNHLIAAYKKSGQTVQPEPGKPLSLEEEVKEYIRIKYNKPGAVFLGVIHRLDMPVNGIVLFARTSKALVRMNESFQQRAITKKYLSLVEGRPPSAAASLKHWLKTDDKRNFTKAFENPVNNALEARLKYKVLKSSKDQSLLEIDLETGRKHQIRAQLSAMGCPILGDVKYGASKPLKDFSIALQAFYLSFQHPVQDVPVIISLENSKNLLKL
ncbi:MAG: RluA family pseudouridine synthase [Bacteroidia bacterium]